MGKKKASEPPAEEFFDVERVLEHRGEGRKMEFLIRWEGLDASQDSWEPLSHVRNNLQWQEYVTEHDIDLNPPKKAPLEQRDGPYLKINEKISDRLERAQTERLYLLSQKDATTAKKGLARTYAVLGSTGNVYNVKICHNPSCTCPDHQKGHICKHIMLVMLKVLKVGKSSLAFQKCLLQTELAEIFAKAPPVPSSVVAPQVVVNAYEHATGSAKKAPVEEEEADDGEECDCPICFEPVVRGKEELERCGTCRKRLHTDCIERWLEHGKNCPMCRGPWCVVNSGVVVSGKKRGRDGGYLNITTGDESPTVYDNYWR
jgi:hypothetical protein